VKKVVYVVCILLEFERKGVLPESCRGFQAPKWW
jgi:hypothetical protein